MRVNTASSTAPLTECQNGHSPMASPFARFAIGLSISVSILVLLGIFTELISIAVLSSRPPNKEAAGLHHSYYKDKPWSGEYWREFELASRTQFKAYIGWRRAPFTGKYINVDENGLRRTVNPDCSPQARQIWIFGSSTLWGMGSPDDQTIPSILSREYAQSIGPVCVTNFGEKAWVSTQNVIQLELALKRASRPPDLVLFYDGFADILSIYQSGNADVHMEFERIRYLVEAGQTKRSSFAYMKETGTYRLIEVIMNQVASLKSDSVPTRHPSRNLDRLAEMSVVNYRANMKVVESLSAKYGFQYVALWSPVIYTGNKPLSRPERGNLDALTQARPGLPELSRKTYDLMFSVSDPHIINISDTFDHTTSDTYLDQGHVTPDGNRLVALRILEIVKKPEIKPTLTH